MKKIGISCKLCGGEIDVDSGKCKDCGEQVIDGKLTYTNENGEHITITA